MSFNVNDKTLSSRLRRNLSDSRKDEANSLSRLASGTIFTQEDPKPAERGIAERMDYKIRSLAAAKRNINDATSLLQTAESAMLEIGHIVTRMKEINVSAANSTVSDQERRYLLVEYDALYEEINRITATTEFNGIKVLDGSAEGSQENLVFRLGDPMLDSEGEDINTLTFDHFDEVSTTTESLGLRSVSSYLEEAKDENGVGLAEVNEMLLPEDEDMFSTVYDEVTDRLALQKSVFGGLQTRLNRARDYVDVYQENISAAKSKIADTDYAKEVTQMVEAKIRSHATTSLLAQTNLKSNLTLQLLNSSL